MAVSIRPKFTPSDIAKMMRQKLDVFEQVILERLKFIGETFVRNARNNGTYRDRTGNLRASIGYVILKNGEQVYGGFPGNKKEGQAAAKKAIDETKSSFPTGYVLIVVAGMEYAASVESRNYDVLTSSSLQAETDLREAIKELKRKLSGKKK